MAARTAADRAVPAVAVLAAGPGDRAAAADDAAGGPADAPARGPSHCAGKRR